ncbi:hypothetical protein FGRMN_8793 [Fusarium graminum]|nr:hypothetical protein FGRMN_8793 [Fusarium graminum]
MDHRPFRDRPNRADAHPPFVNGGGINGGGINGGGINGDGINGGGINSDNWRRPAEHRSPNQENINVDNGMPPEATAQDVAMWLLSVRYPQLRHRTVSSMTLVTSAAWMLQSWDLFEAIFEARPDRQVLRQMINYRITAFTAPLIPPAYRPVIRDWFRRLAIPGSAILDYPYQQEVMMPVQQMVPPHPIELSLRALEFHIAALPPEVKEAAIGMKVEVDRLFGVHERDMLKNDRWQAMHGVAHHPH